MSFEHSVQYCAAQIGISLCYCGRNILNLISIDFTESNLELLKFGSDFLIYSHLSSLDSRDWLCLSHFHFYPGFSESWLFIMIAYISYHSQLVETDLRKLWVVKSVCVSSWFEDVTALFISTVNTAWCWRVSKVFGVDMLSIDIPATI